MNKPVAGLLLSLALWPGTAAALDCQSPMTQTDMNICAGRDYDAADKELNKVYGQIMTWAKANNPAMAKALRTAQRAWIPYRDTTCAWEGLAVAGGTMEPTIVATCKADLTRTRLKTLKDGWATFK